MRRAAAWLIAMGVCIPSRAIAQSSPDRLYESACDAGDLVACNVFGLMNETGQGVPQNLDAARDLYRRACEGGEMVGCTNLGLLYGRGLGVPRDLDLARDRYRAACGGGDALGCDLLAALDSAGVTVPVAVGDRADGAAADSSAQPTYFKRGRAADAESARGLGSVLVEVPDLGIRAVSDSAGYLSLGRLPPGRYYLEASRLGYESVDGMLEVPGTAGFLVLMHRMRIDDPLATGRIRGSVMDAANDEALSNVDITVAGREGVHVLSDARGRFVLDDLKPGLVEVRLQRIGYRSRTAVLVVQPGEASDLRAPMSSEAIELAGIDVTTNGRSGYLDRNGFYDRSRRAAGRQFSREDLDRISVFEMSDAVRRVPGVSVTPTSRSNTPEVPQRLIAMSRRSQAGLPGSCILPVYIDGVRSAEPYLDQIPESQVEAMEVYVANETPIQYRDSDGCGVVLIWTKR